MGALAKVVGGLAPDGVHLDGDLLDMLMPMHVAVTVDGHIWRSGPTAAKLAGVPALVGRALGEVLSIKRPTGVETVADILGHAGVKLAVQMLGLGPHNLKGVAVPLGDGGVLINLSLGAGVAEIVAKRDLKNKDFSPADPTVEMLYMFEVQAVLMRESKNLNLRLQGQKTVAEEQAYTDSLTGLANRRALQNHLARLLRRNRGDGFAVMQIDLDFFKAVNDTHGHAAGDFVLREVSQVLLDVMRATDMVARIGGDEFVVVLPEYGCREALELVGNRIIERVRQPILFEGIECRVGASIGATIVPVGCRRGPETVLSDADRALYRSKEQGRGRYNLDLESSAPTGGPEVAQ